MKYLNRYFLILIIALFVSSLIILWFKIVPINTSVLTLLFPGILLFLTGLFLTEIINKFSKEKIVIYESAGARTRRGWWHWVRKNRVAPGFWSVVIAKGKPYYLFSKVSKNMLKLTSLISLLIVLFLFFNIPKSSSISGFFFIVSLLFFAVFALIFSGYGARVLLEVYRKEWNLTVEETKKFQKDFWGKGKYKYWRIATILLFVIVLFIIFYLVLKF